MIPHYPTIADAILYLEPKAIFIVRNEDVKTIEWIDKSVIQPSDNDILKALETLKLEAKNMEYKAKRSSEYPSIGDQLDSLFHAGLFPEEMASKIQAVKDKYPKE